MCIRDRISSEYIVKDQGYKLAVNKIKDDIGMKTDGLEYLLFSNDKQGKELKTFVNKRIKAVSYTHLDVYKRQPLLCA